MNWLRDRIGNFLVTLGFLTMTQDCFDQNMQELVEALDGKRAVWR
jgi:hypothetical protein